MGYILPIPHFQYRQYRERVDNESSESYSSVDAVERVSFKKVLDDNFDSSVQGENPSRSENSRQREHDAFQVHLAKISGKGIQFNEIV
ncbi:hypothetical protein JOC78_000437 [Bacillus ectoiniformans]|nr:hypothetical protein [Bacillus ectoiniformans]